MHDLFSSRLLSYFCNVVIVLRLVLISFDFYDVYLIPFRIPDMLIEITSLICALSRRYSRRRLSRNYTNYYKLNFWGRSMGKSLLHKFIKATLRHCRASQRRSNSGHSHHEGEQSLFFHTACPARLYAETRQLIPCRGICS